MRLEELESVAEGIGGSEAVVSWELAVLGDRVARLSQPIRKLPQAVDEQARVGLAGGCERLLDTEVHLGVPAAEPAAASSREPLRFIELVHTEYARPECPALPLPVRGGGGGGGDHELHVVNEQPCEAAGAVDEVGVGQGRAPSLAQDASVAVDLEVDGVHIAAQLPETLTNRSAVLEQQRQAGRASRLAIATQVREAPHHGDRHAGGAQVQQKGQPLQVGRAV